MSNGIYLYIDCEKDGEVVYVGKDSNIHKNRRHKQHMSKCNYNAQQINRVLQKNPGRYKYVVFAEGEFSQEELNSMEIEAISVFNPKFNFTNGGEGVSGFTHSAETKAKISEANKGKNHPMYGKNLSAETRAKMSEAKKGEKNPNYKKEARVIKNGKNNNGKIKYGLKYQGKILKQSIFKEKLDAEAERINKGVNNKAQSTLSEFY